MSIMAASIFHLTPSDTGYTLTVDFPTLGSHKEIPFTVGDAPKKGVTFDLYSQNGKIGGEHPLSFFDHKNLRGVKDAFRIPLPAHKKAQCVFVLDLTDADGKYGDWESIRQS